MRPTRHRLHLAPELDDLGVYVWPVPLDPGDTLTLADGRRFRVVDCVEIEVAEREVDRLLDVVSVQSSLDEIWCLETVALKDNSDCHRTPGRRVRLT